MEPTTQQQFDDFYLKDTLFRIFKRDQTVSVYNIAGLSRNQIDNCIRYMILEGMIDMDKYRVHVYSVKEK
jgi:hypothetical protein|tara:strand:- start:250 stop:459 length:210 start_codon:yes stop_codon:yes gene_type:complete